MMQLVAILMTVAFIHVSAAGLAQQVTLSKERITLREVFREINRQTGYDYLWSADKVKTSTVVSVKAQDMPLESVLQQVLKDLPLSYTIENKTILIEEREKSITDRVKDFFSAETKELNNQQPLTGLIVDTLGQPVQGATIRYGNLTTSTDRQGQFMLQNVPPDATLQIRMVGFESQEVAVNGQSRLTIVLKASVSPLDEVQVIAYGTTSRRLSTGNVASVSAKDIEKSPVTNVLSAIQGRIPGIFIEQGSGFAGSGFKVRVQGDNSMRFNGNLPFYVVDGVPYPAELLGNINGIRTGGGSPLAFINPSNIESISVLKDADATSIYGSRAANGAILITTKKGKPGNTQLDVNVNNGRGKVTRTMELANTQQFLEMVREAFRNDGVTNFDEAPWTEPSRRAALVSLLFYDPTRYTDWQKELIGGTANYTDVRMDLSGGSNHTNYRLGGNFNRETSVQPGDFSDRQGSVQFSLNNTSANQRLRIGLSAQYLVDRNALPRVNLTGIAFELPPNAPALYNADGSLNWQWEPDLGTFIFDNPLAQTEGKYQANTNNLIGNATVGYQILDGLDIKALVGYNRMDLNELQTIPSTVINPADPIFPSFVRSTRVSDGSINSWNFEPQLTYRSTKGKSQWNALLGSTFQQTSRNRKVLEAQGFNSDVVMEDLSAASSVSVAGGGLISEYRYNAIFGRLEYNLDNKYIVNANIRRDGSSRFGPESRFNTFASVAGAWLFSEESFFNKDGGLLSFGKLRASFGTTGNDQIGDYQYLPRYNSVTGIDISVPYQPGSTGIEAVGHANPYLQWEETRKLQIGLDIGFFNDRILANFDYYDNRSSNQLLSFNLPAMTGFNGVSANLPATVQNKGWEITINTVNIESSQFRWTTGFNITIPRNKLLAFEDLDVSPYAQTYVIGRSINTNRYFDFAGVNPETGLYQFRDSEGNVRSDLDPYSNDHRTILLNNDPKYYGGLNTSLSYKGLQLDLLLQFVNQLGANYYFGRYPAGTPSQNVPLSVINNNWKQLGDIAETQRYSTSFFILDPLSKAYNAFYAASYSNAAFTNAGYIRLKNLMLSYQIPQKILQRSGLKNIRVYTQGQNLWTLTDYEGYDPESRGAVLPPLRMLTLGLQVIL
ncbi:SusC/RagA family TonB-linked outer membrane protein [Parapedobacter sp. DT-150]